MLNRLRQPGSTLRSGRLMRACAALLSRALVPVGYMLGNDAPDGGFAVLLCPAHSELPADGQTLPARSGQELLRTSALQLVIVITLG
jgi:hypothetical protein